MGRQDKTQAMLEVALEVLQSERPMTVRQVYYQLVSRLVCKNTRSQYQAVSRLLVEARQEGRLPWDWIEDRLRRPREVSMWHDLAAFGQTAVKAYRRDVWAAQPQYLEVWLEKDALSGIFEAALRPYGVTLNVGRGYDGWDSIHNAAARFDDGQGATVLYFGDLDPSGEDMVRSLSERLAFFDCCPEMVKCALLPEDIDRYKLPPAIPKTTDTRHKKFVAEYGEVSVELDALPPSVLRQRLVSEVEARLDMAALAQVKAQEKQERAHLAAALGA